MHQEYTLYSQTYSQDELLSFMEKFDNDLLSDPHARWHTIVRLIEESTQRAGSVLDYGCGWGFISRQLSQKGFTVLGIDLFQNEINICNLLKAHYKLKGDVHYKQILVSEVETASMDCVTSNQVIEHVHNPGIYLSEINRILKVGGALVISIPNIMTFSNIVQHSYKKVDQALNGISKEILKHYSKADEHIHAWDAFHFTALLATVGFAFEKCLPSEGLRMPEKIPILKCSLPDCYHTKNEKLLRYSKTLVFSFTKVKDVIIQHYE